jgi:hypothetical protein
MGIIPELLSLHWNRWGWSLVRAAFAQPVRRAFRDLNKYSGTVPFIIALLFVARPAYAGEIEPRAYINRPVRINFLLAGFACSDGGLSTETFSPIQDAQLLMPSGILAYARALDVWGKSGKIDMILSYSQLSGSATVAGQTVERDVSDSSCLDGTAMGYHATGKG